MRIVSLSAFFLIAACAPKTEEICQASIKRSLINPETVEFFEIIPISRVDYETEVKASILAESNLGRSEWSNFKGSLKPRLDDIMSTADKLSANDFTARRVKAESKIGMNVTSSFICASDGKENCGCMLKAD